MKNFSSIFLIFHFSFFILFFSSVKTQQTFPVNGTHDMRHTYYAFTHAHIFQDYATVLDDATLLVKDGQIIDIGTAVTIPEGAVVNDCKGKTIYPSFIDLFTGYGMAPLKPMPRVPTQLASSTPGPYDWNQAVKAQIDAEDLFHVNLGEAWHYRNLGF